MLVNQAAPAFDLIIQPGIGDIQRDPANDQRGHSPSKKIKVTASPANLAEPQSSRKVTGCSFNPAASSL
jgi:hypothetical protein